MDGAVVLEVVVVPLLAVVVVDPSAPSPAVLPHAASSRARAPITATERIEVFM